MSRKYKFHNKQGAYFISFATVYWLDIFTRQVYFNVLEESIEYCRAEKGMEVYAYCFMPSHVHLIFRSSNEDPSGLIRDFKGFTARKLIKAIEENPQESRKEWLLFMMERAGKTKSNVKQHQFWQQHNQPVELWSEKVIQQKINYIHNNPVKSGFVTNPIDWKYSSARNYQDDQTVLEIDI
ncbi:transposase, IS200 family [Psychroflexus torquis ATCC 700755]|uniref:Transposase, IS200 family n=1 Tax=Psychroflexus torquis (strain ATCC 700755 / CIP 106069 / ACAM 623) TaxID=313595 RepID=K4IBH7_PSYTT|nr:transposase [Psychroflexus torquis]AFU67263.1 transposase, IS200 family [Psychroflexus torquis ATCC 700755]